MSVYDTPPQSIPTDFVPLVFVQMTLPSLLIAHTFLIPLLPVLFVLFYYSTPFTRRRPIFVLNIVSLILAVCVGIMAEAAGAHTLLSPQKLWPQQVSIATIITGVFQSILVDLILLVRLVSVYNLSQVGVRRFAAITGLPITLKFVRVVNILICMKALTEVIPHGNVMEAWITLPSIRIEWVCQVVDNSYASIIFIRTIRDRGLRSEYSEDGNGDNSSDQRTLTQTLRTLFRIALSNFVIPSIFSVAQLVVLFVNPYSSWLIDLPYVNGMLSVYGVVFASVWVGKESRRRAKETKHASYSGNGSRSRKSSSALKGLADFNTTSKPTVVSVSVMETITIDHNLGESERSAGVDKGRRVLDLDELEGHEMALVPFTKRDSENILPV